MELTDPSNISRADIAEVLGISTRHITRLFKEGIFKQNKKGKYDLAETVQIYVAYMSNGKAQNELVDSRKKLEGLKAQKEEMIVKKMQGALLDIEEVKVVVSSAMQIIATQMDGQAGRIAHELASLSDAGIVRQTLLNENRKIRQSAADKLYLLGSIRHDGGNPKTATPKKRRSVGKRKKSTTTRKRRTRAVEK